MGSRALTIKRHDLERFVTDFQDKAVDFLLRSCHEQETEKEILRILLDESSTSIVPNMNTRAPPPSKTSPISQRSGSFSGHRRQASHGYMGLNAEPPSPPKSRSNHSKSLSGKDGIENILILSPTEDDDIKKSVASMKPAQIKYSIIGEHMFKEGRIPESSIDEIEEQRISIPQRGFPGTLVSIRVSSCAELTWKSMRPAKSTSKASHHTVFYLVPQEFLDIDVLLGVLDSGEGQVFDLKEDESYHRSDNAGRVQSDEILNSFIRSQREQDSATLRTAPVAQAKQRGETSRTSQHVTGDPGSSTQTTEQTGSLGRVRISCALDSENLGIRLDLDADPEAFINNVQKEFRRRRLPFVQANTAIWLKPEKDASDDDALFMSLEEDDLAENWLNTIRWLRTHKQANPNAVYGVFQIEND